MKLVNKIIIFLILIALCACQVEFQESELIGTYKANHGKGEDIIVLKENGKYLHTFKTSENLFEREGNWEYEIFKDQPLISFYNFQHRWRDNYYTYEFEKGERNIWPAFIERTIFGKITLPLDDDLGFYYEKVEIK